MTHEFHFVITQKMYSKLEELSVQLEGRLSKAQMRNTDLPTKAKLPKKVADCKLDKEDLDGPGISTTIVFIINQLIPFFEKNHLMAKEKNSLYKLLDGTRERREHVHCYLPEVLYRKMKLLHQDLNTYSLGQILRRMLTYFLMGCVKYGIDNFIDRLNKIENIWKDKKKAYMKENRVFVKQLSCGSTKFFCRTIYGMDSRPYFIQLIE